MHREITGMHRNARELTGAHGIAQERRIISDKGHNKRPINSRTSTHLSFAVVVTNVLFFVMLLRILFE